MTCPEVRPLLSAYYDRELEPAQLCAVAEHLAACPACRQELNDFGKLGELLGTGRDCRVPVGLWERIAASADRSRRPRRLGRDWLVRLGAVAAGFVLYLLGHDVAASIVPRNAAQAAETTQVEIVLRETAAALAGPGLGEDHFASLGHRPEMLVLQELTEGIEP